MAQKLNTLYERLKPVSYKWLEIGNQLEVSHDILNGIDRDIHLQDCNEKLYAVLEQWIRLNPNETPRFRRNSLKKALSSDSVSENVLADSLDSELDDNDYQFDSSEINVIRIQNKIEAFEERFSDLHVCLLQELDVSKGTTVRRFGRKLTSLPLRVKEQHFAYISASISNLMSLPSFDLVFLHLNMYWNFLDYTLLEQIIKMYGKLPLKNKMKKYVTDLREFRCHTTVKQLIEHWPGGRIEIPPRFTKMDVKYLDINPETCNLERLETLRQQFCGKVNLSPFAFMVFQCESGCLVVSWMFPSELLGDILPFVLKSYVMESYVKSVFVDGVRVEDKMMLIVCKRGKLEMARSLIASGVNVNAYFDEDNAGPLHLASQSGHRDVVKLLLKSNAKLEAKKKNKATPLMLACWAGHTAVVQLLLERGADPKAKTDVGQTPLIYACNRGHLSIAQFLLEHGAKVNEGNKWRSTPLTFACEHGHEKIVSLLLDHGADVKLRNVDEASPLSFACQHGHPGIVRLLLARKAPTEERNKRGATPLIVGSAVGHDAVVKVMLDQGGAKIDAATTKRGLTSLMIAALNGHLKVVQLLLSRGAKVDAQSKDGYTALIIAVQSQNEELVNTLLSQKAKPNIAEKETGWTAIFFAAKSGQLDIVKMLIDHGANVDHKDKNNVTATDVSAQSPNPEEVRQLLLEHSKVKLLQEENKKRSEQIHKAHQYLEKIYLTIAESWAPAIKDKLLAERARKRRATEFQRSPAVDIQSFVHVA